MTRKPARGVSPHGEFEAEFHRLLGRLVHATARFDFNVGLQLRFLGAYYQEDVADDLNPLRTKLNTRLKTLKRLVLSAFEPAGDAALEEFRAWFKRADESRALCNDYVHGRWGVPGAYKHSASGAHAEAEPLLSFLRLHWDMDPDRPDDSVTMSLAEFAEQVSEAEVLFAGYWQLSERYLEYTSPARSP